MKRALLLTLSVIAVCSLCFAGTVNAAMAGYGFQIATGTTPTFDGAVSPAGEWDDSYKDWLYNGWTISTSFFRTKWLGAPTEGWLIEVLTDTTNSPGDNFQFSVDVGQEGGAAPGTNDFLINVTGHSTVAVFQGTGTGWGASSAAVTTDYIVATSIATSPASATPHWIIEIYLNKQGAFAMGMSNNMRMAAYDASTGQTVMWPPYSSANNPNTYGTGTTEFTGTIPEGLTVGVMVLLSSVAAMVSIRYFRKQPRIKSNS